MSSAPPGGVGGDLRPLGEGDDDDDALLFSSSSASSNRSPSASPSSDVRGRRRMRRKKKREQGDDETSVAESASNSVAPLEEAAVPVARPPRLLVTMTKDILLIILGYVCLFSPPSFVSDNLNFSLASTLTSRKASAPEPFFVESAWVDDFFAGDIFAAFEEAQQHRDAFFMFYAPWDVDCERAKDTLEKVANVFEDHSDIYFAAVNCWTSEGECYKEFGAGKPNQGQKAKAGGIHNQFPIFVFYPKDRKGIQYYGPVTTHLLIQFLLNAQNPLAVIRSKDDLLTLRATSNGMALVGYFPDLNPSKLSLNYRRYLQASYDLLESDPFRTEVGPFAVVVSQELAFHLQLNINQPLRYFYWNSSSAAYPNKTITSVSSLMSWSWRKSREKLTTWIGTTGRKSQTLAQHLHKDSGLSLLAFIPRTLHRHYNRALSVLQETALKYYSCVNTSDKLVSPLLLQMEYLRKTSFSEQEYQIRQCAEDRWFQNQYCRHRTEENCVCNLACQTNSTFLGPHVFPFKYLPTYRRFMKSGPVTDSHVSNVKVLQRRLACALVTSKETNEEACDIMSGKLPLESWNDEMDDPPIYGLGCQDNRTLSFYTLNSAMQRELAESFGASLRVDAPLVLIADIHDESLYQMTDPFSSKALLNFIHSFHRNKASLTKLQLTANVPESRETTGEKEGEPKLRIHEISRLNFASVVLNSTENIVLLYQSSSCGLCASYAHVFHTVQHILWEIKNLTFATVDAGKNDLPWHFTALSVPSVLFFPEDKAETRAFPSHKALNVPNLLSFIVANLPVEVRLRLSASLCDNDCLQRSVIALTSKIESIDLQKESSATTLSQLQKLGLFLHEEQERRLGHDLHELRNYDSLYMNYIQNEKPSVVPGRDEQSHFHNEL